MTEQSPSDFRNSKLQSSATETKKTKKSSKKKANEKPSNGRTETLEPLSGGLNQEVNFDLLHYAMKLEHEVHSVKKELKTQRKKFRQIINGLAQHFDAKGVGSQEINDYIAGLGPKLAENDELESNYEKFFTVHKYHIAEDSNNHKIKQIPLSGHRIENGTNSTEIPKLAIGDSVNSSQNIEEKADKNDKKKARKNSKAVDGEVVGEDAPKKRKYTKKNKQNEEEQKVQGLENDEIQEIPPFQINKETPSKGEAKNRMVQEHSKGYEEVAQHPIQKQYDDLAMLNAASGYGVVDPSLNALLKQMNTNPLMNLYSVNPASLGMPEELYQKIFEDMLKTSSMRLGNMGNMVNAPDKGRGEMMNYFQGTFK